MPFRSLRCHGFVSFGRFSSSSVSAQRLLTILSMSCICGTSAVFFRILKLVLIAAVGNADRISEARLVLTSYVLHGGMRDLVLHGLSIKLLIWTVVAAASGCFCRVLIVAVILTCLWVRVGPLFSTRCEPLRLVSVYKHVGTWVSSAASYQRDITHKASVATTGYLQAVKTVFSRRQSRLLSNSGGWSEPTLPQLAKLESVRSRVLRKNIFGEVQRAGKRRQVMKRLERRPKSRLCMC